MTVLDSQRLGENIIAKLYQAPYHESNCKQRILWAESQIPFFHLKLFQFWNLCLERFENEKYTLPKEIIKGDRKRFIRKPIITLENSSLNSIIGGVWFEPTKITDYLKQGTFHMSIRREHREYSYPFWKYVEKSFKNDYDAFHCSWGPRMPKDDPTNFFQRNGFDTLTTPLGGEARRIVA